jgi:rod shape-determining protein MreC
MINLIRFIQKHHVLLLFLLLEIIALNMLFRSNAYHRSAAFTMNSTVSGVFYRMHKSITDYFYLQQTNEQLAQENAYLRQQLQHNPVLSEKDSMILTDTVFHYIPARVVSNNVHFRNNYIILNKGYKSGIEKDMGIISPEGVAGIIIGVSKNYAIGMSMLHKFTAISVRFKNNGNLANLSWQGGDYRFGIIDHIPTHLVVNKGDTLITSGNSHLFPEGILVGTVENYITSDDGALNQARIRFATDFNRLRQVYVVDNKHRSELDSLLMNRVDE